MKMYMKGLIALLLGLLAALPLLGGDTCGGGGENGVWILPNRSQFTSSTGTGISGVGQLSDARASIQVNDLTHNFVMQASGSVGHIVASLGNANLGVFGVSVCGTQITVSAALMAAIATLPNSRCEMLVIDENYCGYLMTMAYDSNHRLRVYVY